VLRLLSKFFIWVTGWKIGGIYPLPKEVREKCVVIAVPHTTNWDLPYTIAFMAMLQVKIRYTIKKEWIFFPMNLILSPLGAIPIDRSPKVKGQERLSTTEAMIKLFDENDKLALVIPPEGTRSLRTEWKTRRYLP
jgi:1-acyl-sn-glycerol-3-phosphate acyltransferase